MKTRNGSAAAVLGGLVLMIFVAAMMGFSYNNSFVAMEEQVKSSWAQVDSQLKRRADLIPNLVESVKGYASHETAIFGKIADARAKLAGGGTPAEKMQANSELTSGMNRLLAVAEAANPDLKSAPLFRGLMDELAGTENRLAVERMRYNENVQKLNTALHQLPGSLVAGVMGFRTATYFETPPEEKVAPKVSFGAK